MTIQRIFYTSRIVDEDTVRGAAVARQIAESSSARNAQSGLTGSLAFVDGHFVQVTEGAQGPLEDTFERICRDFRHRELKLIDYQTVPTRHFAQWNMACLVDDDDTPHDTQEALSEIRLLATVNVREAVAHMRRLLDAYDVAAHAA